MLSALKGSGDALALVAKELALDLGQCEYVPHIIEHLPGVANITADALSHRFDPEKQVWSVPPMLQGIPPAQLQAREPSWWRVHTAKQLLARQAAWS